MKTSQRIPYAETVATHRESRLLHPFSLASAMPVFALAFVIATSGRAQQEQKQEQAKEIHQGSYVEKVEPGVDYKNRLPRYAPLAPKQSLKQFHTIPGFHIELAAAEPLIRDPVAIAFDEDGRMIVAELITYSEAQDTLQGRVSILEDVDHDGFFEKGHVLVDRLGWPSGVLSFDGGVFVASPPDLLYCKDTNGDGKADVREVVITGFKLANPNQCINSLRWNFDNRVELMPSGGGGILQPLRWQKQEAGRDSRPMQIRGRDLSFNPRTGAMRPESGGSQFGMTFDAFGRKFESSNSAPIEMVMYEDRYIARNPYLAAPSSRIPIWVDGSAVYRTSPVEPWRIVRTEMRVRGVFSGPIEGGGKPDGYFTSACGVMIYNGGAWPPAMQGNAFVCEGASNLVHRMRIEPNGVALTAHRTEQKREFLTSDEVWFKPVQLHNGPDGMLYVVDMYREIFEHPDAVPPSVRKYIDLNTGNDRGRIYRVVPNGTQPRRQPPMSGMTVNQLAQCLLDPNVWVRRTAARLLYEHQDRSVLPTLEKLAVSAPAPVARVHALYALAGLDTHPEHTQPKNAQSVQTLSEDIVLGGLNDASARVREHAIRLSERWLDTSPAIRARLYALADDSDMRVRYQLAFTLGGDPGQQATAALAEIARQDIGDRWITLAILSSCTGRPGDLFAKLASDPKLRRTQPAIALLETLAQQAGLQSRNDQIAEILGLLDHFSDDDQQLSQSTVRGLSRGLAHSNSKDPLLASLRGAGGSRAATLLADMIAAAKKTAGDADATLAERVAAIQSLTTATFEEAETVLVELLDSRQPQAVQTTAIRTLSHFTDPAIAELIVEYWAGFSPNVRREAAEALFARKKRLKQLFQALEDGTITTSQLDPARLDFLRKHPDSEIREKATQLLAGDTLARRADVVASYGKVLDMQGDGARGKVIFKRECSQCHLLQGVGFDLGLPLQNVKSRGAEGILTQVLDPNREVNPAYLNYTALTDRGRLITGVITAETATSITLSRAEGEQDTILRANIDELESTDLSIMPEGLELKVNQQEMADLIAYLLEVVE